MRYDVAIIGSGPAGYTAAIYAARAELNPLLYAGYMGGGQLMITTEVDNYPGFPAGITGPELMANMRAQADRFGTKIIDEDVEDLSARLDGRDFILESSSGSNSAKAVILATGASAKWLNIPGEKEFQGKGVSACATCDGFFFRGKRVAVIGGGDTAMEEATYLAKMCEKVYIVHRRNEFRASPAMLSRARSIENIEFVTPCTPYRIMDSPQNPGRVSFLHIHGPQEAPVETAISDPGINGWLLPVDGVFVAIGHTPNSKLVEKFGITLPHGYVITELGSTHTKFPGLFACGDVQDSIYRQAVTAAASGCMAALDAQHYLAE